MFAILLRQNYKLLKSYNLNRGHYKLLHQNLTYATSRLTSKGDEQEAEEEASSANDDDDDDEECDRKPSPPPTRRVCPPDPCKAPPSEGPCPPPPSLPPGPGSGLFGAIGPKQMAVLVAYIPCLMRYGVVAVGVLIYLTDWKTVLQYLPFYNGKYTEGDDAAAPPPKAAPPKEDAPKPEEDKKEC